MSDGKRIIVTGAAGTVGAELVNWLLRTKAAEVRGIDSNENGLFVLAEALRHEPRFHPFICDVPNQAIWWPRSQRRGGGGG